MKLLINTYITLLLTNMFIVKAAYNGYYDTYASNDTYPAYGKRRVQALSSSDQSPGYVAQALQALSAAYPTLGSYISQLGDSNSGLASYADVTLGDIAQNVATNSYVQQAANAIMSANADPYRSWNSPQNPNCRWVCALPNRYY